MNKAKTICAKVLELNLKKKTGRNGENRMQLEETGSNRKTKKKETRKNEEEKTGC